MIWLVLALLVSESGEERQYRRYSWPTERGLNTRDELFSSRCVVLEATRRGKPRVVRCLDQYTGELYEGSTRGLDVEHRVAFHSVFFRIPAEHWPNLRQVFADAENLMLVGASLNRSRGNKGPHEWCPPNPEWAPWLAFRSRRFLRKYGIAETENERRGYDAWERGECLAGAGQ